MKYISILVFVALYYVTAINSSNILAFLPSPWKSHVVSFQPLFLELARRGHNVTVISQFAISNPPTNYTQVITKKELDFKSITKLVVEEYNNTYRFLFDEIHMRMVIGTNITETYVSSPVVQKFIKEDRSKFDLVIVESFFQECTVAMGHKYGAPVIGIIPVAPWVTQSLQAANPLDFSYIKDFKLNAGKSIDFSYRLLNTLFGLYGLWIEPIVYLPKMQHFMDKYFQYPGYENRPPLTEMLKNISLSLIDSDVMILSPRPYVPNFIEVPGIHLQPTKDMSKKLQHFMDTAYTGVVYFNFGTVLNIASFPKHHQQVFFNVLGRLEQKVIFNWPNNDTQKFPDNFFVDSWFPQLEILKHPNCKLFITHGGVHGIMETIVAGVPLLGFPVFGDQFQNVKICQENGIGIMSDVFTLAEKTFERDVRLLLTDQKFKENAKKMSTIFHDRPMSAMDTAIYWVEYVIRHKGAHHLRSPALELSWYQYYLLDVISFLMSIVVLLILICYFMCNQVVKLLRHLLCKQKID